MRFLSIVLILLSHSALSQYGRHYFQPREDVQVEYAFKTIVDTFWMYRDSMDHWRKNAKSRYTFPVRLVKGDTVRFGQSRRIGGSDPDFNCSYPRQLTKESPNGEIVICNPPRPMMPPYLRSLRYVVNSTAGKRDTLVVSRIYLWADRDTLHDRYMLGSTALNVVSHKTLENKKIIYLNLHENEQTSIEALRLFSEETPINYFYLHHDTTRRIYFHLNGKEYNVDPNRMFTENGLQKTLEDGGAVSPDAIKEVSNFARRIGYRFSNAEFVVAMHNNTEDNYSILSYLPEGSEAQNTAELHINPEMDPDDFVYTTDSLIFARLKVENVNVILQDNADFVDDGSLSVFCGSRNIRYANIETQDGHLKEQLDLMRILFRIMSDELQE